MSADQQESGGPDALSGLVVVVTGASSGIGEATARALHAVGALPVLAARRGERLAELSEELGGALGVVTDVTSDASVAQLVEATVARHGRIDALVNNAGAAMHDTPVHEVDPDDLATLLGLNVVAVVRVLRAVVPVMRAAGSGRIVNVSSGTTRLVPVGAGAYAASKAALNMLSAVSRAELADEGIVVSTVLPSTTATEFGGGRYEVGVQVRPGIVGQSPEYVAQVLLRALRTGEAEIDIPHGGERDDVARTPGT